MSEVTPASFTALNVDEDDMVENEERIREVQVEEAFKLFQEALKYQYNKDWENASETYSELFKLEIFNTKLAGVIPPSLHSLKYLAYKNHGQLVLDWVRLNENPSEHLEQVNQGVIEFVEALIHDSRDSDFWLKVSTYFPVLKQTRMTRFALECALNTIDNKTVIIDEGMKDDIPLGINEISALSALRKLLSEFGDHISLSRPVFNKLAKTEFNDTVKRYIEKTTSVPTFLCDISHENTTLSEKFVVNECITLSPKMSWISIGESLLKASSVEKRNVFHLQTTKIICSDFEPAVNKEIIEMIESQVDDTFTKSEISNEEDQHEDNKRRKRRSFGEENAARSSKRVRARVEEQAITQEDKSASLFVRTVEEIFSPYVDGESFLANVLGIAAGDETPIETLDFIVRDFAISLHEWKDSNGKLLLNGDDFQGSLNDTSRLFDIAIGKTSLLDTIQLNDNDDLEPFIQFACNDGHFLANLAIAYLRNLIVPKDASQNFNNRKWPLSLENIVLDIILEWIELLHHYVSDIFKQSNSQFETHGAAEFAEALFEILVNYYMDKSRGDVPKKRLSANFLDLIQVWRDLSSDLVRTYSNPDPKISQALILRHEWAAVVLEQTSGNAPDDVFLKFENFKKVLEDYPDILIKFPNTPYIPTLSMDGVEKHLSKLQTATVFSSIFESSNNNTIRKIHLLETVLRPSFSTAKTEFSVETVDFKAVEQFIISSPMSFRFHLWDLLRDCYDNIGDSKNSFYCLVSLVCSIMDDLSNKVGSVADLYSHLYFLRDLYEQLVSKAIDDENQINMIDSRGTDSALKATLSLLRILHVYVIHDDNVSDGIMIHSESSISTKTRRQLTDLLVNAWAFAYILLKKKLIQDAKPENIQAANNSLLNLLSVLHEELGIRGYCAVANGVFLRLVQDELLRMDNPDSETEMLQCMHCRFGLALGNEVFFPYDHKAITITLDKQDATALVRFIMAMAMRRRPSQQLPRSDMKQVLDKFCEVIGVPRRDQTAIYYNQCIIDNYISQSINPLLFQKALQGTEGLSTVPVKSDFTQVAMIGLYYLQGQIYLTQYRSRKRTSAGRTEDLDYAMRYFKHDLVCNTNRFESWYGLAQAFDAQAEDEMTWSADKLNTDVKSIAAIQRRALLCFTVATTLLLRAESYPSAPSVMANFFTDFGYELYSSARPPLSMEVYRHSEEFDRYFSSASGMLVKPSHSELKISSVLKLALHMFQLSIRKDDADWRNYYMTAKCLGKLQYNPVEILDVYLEASKKVKEKGAQGDPIFEPHYKLIASVFKYLNSGKINVLKGLEYLKQSLYYKEPETEVSTLKDLYELIIDMMLRLRSADKKRWHHKHTYRIATIYDKGLANIDKAKEEISSFYNLKAAKSFMSIWKPEFERAGRHFVYTQVYTMYYIDILERTLDLETMMLLARKIRRLLSVMVGHAATWERLCAAIAHVLKVQAGVVDISLESLIAKISVEEFSEKAARLEKICLKLKPMPKLLKALYDNAELRKLNMGLASAAMLDDAFGSMYVVLYNTLPELESSLRSGVNTGNEQTVELNDLANEDVKSLQISSQPPSLPQSRALSPISDVVKLEGENTASDNVALAPASTSSSRPRTARLTRKEVISKANAIAKPLVDGAAAKENKEKKEKDEKERKDKEHGKSKEKDDKAVKNKEKDKEQSGGDQGLALNASTHNESVENKHAAKGGDYEENKNDEVEKVVLQ
ncbi:hypothetical protein V1514DRAFT_290341 [Lipomyces japonicus]|uniref:uncharacterized protein n=1 Tax=Lipomyces japonicus TaxID=56871 RepID=UPI0034CD3121